MQWSDAQRTELRRLLADYRDRLLPEPSAPPEGIVRPSVAAYLRQSLDDLHRRRLDKPGNRLIPRHVPNLPAGFAFFPLQVKQDSQLTVHSPLYGNRLEEAVLDVRNALRSIDPELRLLVKLHPADLRKSDYDPMVRACPDVIWAAGGDVRGLLERSRCVITVNSTVGIEGLIYGKPVVVLGNSPYGYAGLVHRITAKEQLAETLRTALASPPDENLVDQYLMFLYFSAFTRGHWRDYAPESLRRVAERIALMAHQEVQPAAGAVP
jgi:capsular polysaccharide export protein